LGRGRALVATFKSLLTSGLISALVSAAALAEQAPYDIRTGDDLSRLKTFGFKTVKPDDRITKQTTTYDSPIMDERTQAAIAGELESRGLKRNDKDPDVWVTTRQTFRTVRAFYPYPDPWFASGWGWPYGGSRYVFDQASLGPSTRGNRPRNADHRPQDATSGAAVARRRQQTRPQTSSPSHRVRRVDDEVGDVFEDFPLPDTNPARAS
jgi:hypothetical protein